MAHTVVGFFDNADEAQNAIRELVDAGFDESRIDISVGESGSANYTSENSGNKKSGLVNFFNSLFGDDSDDAKKYSSVGEGANTIVTVHATSQDEAENAADILDDFGAFNIDERAAEYGYSTSGTTAGTTGFASTGVTDTDNDQTIERIEEELQVGKRTVETGGVRVRSRIVERPVEENVRLRQERVRVDRQAVDRPVSGDTMRTFEEREIEMTESAEVPVVNKEARVVEEIRVSKEIDERNETIRDTVRNTEVDIDDNTTTRSNL